MEYQKESYYRFLVYHGEEIKTGEVKRIRTTGMAYLREGQQVLTLRLWTFINERFYLILNQNDASKYWIMTREPNRGRTSKNKYFWNIVGRGDIDTLKGVVRLYFDLFETPIYMNLHPEASAQSSTLAGPEAFGEAHSAA